MLAALGLKVDCRNGPSSEQAEIVAGQDPGAAASVEKGTTVTLTVSPCDVEVPNVTGRTEADARAQLGLFDVDVSTREVSDQSLAGLVVEQSLTGVSHRGATIELAIGTMTSTTQTTVTTPTTTTTTTAGP